MIPSAGFVPAVALQTKFTLSSKFLRNPGWMLKTSTHVLSTSRKHMTGFLMKSSGKCCGSTVLTAACYWLSSHCISAQKFVSVSWESNPNCSPLLLDSDRVCAVTALHSLHELDRQPQLSWGGCHSWELQDQLLTFYGQFGTANIFSTGSSACSLSVFSCVQLSRNEI